jgi:hypothetical protein
MTSMVTILDSLPWYAWIPIVAIVCATIGGVFKASVTHRERMAMIKQGMHPDTPNAKPYEQAEV